MTLLGITVRLQTACHRNPAYSLSLTCCLFLVEADFLASLASGESATSHPPVSVDHYAIVPCNT